MTFLKNFKFFWMMLFVPFLLQGKDFEIQGHRGNKGMMPENTMPAFISAVECGTDVLEMDLHVTQDGIIVIHHDYYVNQSLCRCQKEGGQSTLILETPLAELKAFDCGMSPDPKHPRQACIPGTPIPTLQELFDYLKNSPVAHARKVRLNLELKRDPYHPEWSMDLEMFANKVIHLVHQNGFQDRVYYSSFDPEILMAVRKQDAGAVIGFLYEVESLPIIEEMGLGTMPESIIKIAQSFQAQIISPESVLLTEANLERFKNAGFRVIPWVINEQNQLLNWMEMGVDGIITDYPEAMILAMKNMRPF